MPKISIIVPVYNVEEYLPDCLDSLINQTFKDIEIICVNDGSPDDSIKILEKYQNKDSRIKIISQENRGLSGARNSGLKIASGEYISFVDSDDWLDLNFFEELYKACTEEDASIAVACMIRKRKLTQKYRFFYKKRITATTLQDKLDLCSIPKCCYVCGKLFKRELIEKHTFEENRYFEDILWIPEIIKKANKITGVPNTNYFYRVNGNSIVKKIPSPKKQFDSYYAKKRIIKFYKENNVKLEEKYQNITKSIKYFSNILIYKIKEKNDIENFYLFGFLKIPAFLENLFVNLNIFVKKIFSISVFDCHLMIYIFGIQIRKKLKTKPKTIELKDYGITKEKRNPKIIASLTTFPDRINIVSKTIKTILNQTMKADEVILQLAIEQFPNKENDLPKELIDLKNYGLTIKFSNDIKSYKKLIPTLKEYKNDIIITFDDDIYYDNDIIQSLYNSYLIYPECIHTNRGHRIFIKNNSIIAKPNSDIYWKNYSKPSYKNTIIGCGGVLYPPNCFDDRVLDEEKFKKIIPTQDDIWFWAMTVLNKRKIEIVKSYSMQIQTIENSQNVGLCKINNKKSNGKNSFKTIEKEFSEIIDIIKEEK